MWTGDNLPVMRGMNDASVDLIYLDPPFNSRADYAAPIGSKAAGAAFKDTWTLRDIDVAGLDLIEQKHPTVSRVIRAALTNSDKSYLIYVGERLLEMRRLLKATGSIYLHCDPTMSHYLKLLMDAIFGRKNFRNEIVWWYKGTGDPMRMFPRKHDIILFYGKSTETTYNKIYIEAKKTSGWTGKSTKRCDSVWEINTIYQSAERHMRTGYPTEKPLALLKRVIRASSNEGDTVLDPFCGCATACVAAHELGRQWVGIDVSSKAFTLVRQRIRDMGGIFYNIIHRQDVPIRNDIGKVPRYNSAHNKETLYGEQQGYCAGCGEHFKLKTLTIDHIIARSVGGTDHISNLHLLCGHCNSLKGNRGMEYLAARLNEYNMRPRLVGR